MSRATIAFVRHSSALWLAFFAAFLLGGCGTDKVVFAPKQQRIAFASERGGLRQAYVVGVDGQGLIRVSWTSGRAYAPKWKPGGGLLIFSSSDSTDEFSDIFTVAPNGTGQTNLTQTPGIFDLEPAWSPDGTKITFASTRDGPDYDIYVMNSDGSTPKRLTSSPGVDGGAMWSPNGDWIAFQSGRNDTSDLYLMRPDGSDLRRITRSVSVEYDPEWSPDGSAIVFHGGNIDTTQIYVVAWDGASLTRLTNSSHSVREPTWSPDGTKIAYAAEDGLHIMNRDGSNDHPIPNTDRFDHAPVWSPDGRAIAFVNEVGNNGEVCVIRTDGSGRLNLSLSMYFDTTPTWEPLP
jgi:TolB protein